MIRLGLCCMFHDVSHIRYRTTTATASAKLGDTDRLAKFSELCLNNAKMVLYSIDFCIKNGIGSFRLSSDLFPIKTHPTLGYTLDDLPDGDIVKIAYKECGHLARENNIRLGIHPDQFVVMNSPHENVVQASVRELEHHDELANLIGADTINIHAGGVYGDRMAALARLKENLGLLSKSVRSKLTFENDDRSYTPQDLLPVCFETGIPLVYDVHHHRCKSDAYYLDQVTDAAIKTWGDREPLFHISSSKSEEKFRDHSDYIDPNDFPDYWLEQERDITVEVEAKHKEVAVLRLREAIVNHPLVHCSAP